MTYVPPTGVANASWVGASAYTQPVSRLSVSWDGITKRWITPAGKDQSYLGEQSIKLAYHYISPASFNQYKPGLQFIDHDNEQSYRPQQWTVNASWVGYETYNGASGAFLKASWDISVVTISTAGINDSHVSEPLLFGTQFAIAQGFSTYESGFKHYALFPYEYAPPQWVLDASWVGKDTYTPQSITVNAAWALPSESKQVSLTGFDELRVGLLSLERMLEIASPQSIEPPSVPQPSVLNSAKPIMPTGFDSSAYGRPEVDNWWKFVNLLGYKADLHGSAYVQGGVKTLLPGSILALSVGKPSLLNTTADQQAKPQGITAPALGLPDVSPRSLFAKGLYAYSTGFALVQFPPQPRGWQSSTFGYGAIEYKTKQVYSGGIDSYATGYPDIRDRAKYIQHKSALVTSVFGDISIRQINQRVTVQGFYSLESGDWSVVFSNRRSLAVPSIQEAEASQNTEIYNKTPSFAPSGFNSAVFGGADIGWKVRQVKPSGVANPFNQIPVPSLWQTPSLKPLSIASVTVPNPTIWPAIREINVQGRNSFVSGSAGIDFSYRRVVAEGRGIAGGSYGTPRIEDTNRALAILGREYLAFGNTWVSRSQRALVAIGIEEPLMSSHKIGGTQFVGAEGFEATRWLTRITPESREFLSKAFRTDSYGVPKIQNHTRYLELLGITTYPEQFMHWGVARLWNRTQVVVMPEDDQQSGLVPPAWSKWTLIENRNKRIGAIGFNASKIERPLVENKARRVAARAIEPELLPEFQKTGSVTHRIRPLPLVGIESPHISGWAVVYNKAFPLKPEGILSTNFGSASVVNLRRLFNIQGFFSAENGYPFISYAIRDISFESRYGIAPPRVELPTVDLWTRYAEPASITGYGVGHPSLGIFWQRLTPRWTHSEKFGSPFVRNLTPESQTKGRATDEYGLPFVRLGWRPLIADGHSMQLFGSARIADRKQNIVVAGNNYMTVSDKIIARRTGQEPVITQNIDLRIIMLDENGDWVESDEGFGIGPPDLQVGRPDLTKGYVYPDSSTTNGNHLRMGNPVITANTIRVQPGYGELLVGEPFVSLKIRTLEVKPLDGTEIEVGKPRLSPHTIYAVLEATDQAMRNHDMQSTRLRPVNAGARFGWPKVTTYLGVVKPSGITDYGPSGNWGSGRPTIIMKLRTITVKGMSVGRMGWVTIPGDQEITLEDSENYYVSGSATVNHAPYVGPITISPKSVVPAAITGHLVERFHREVMAKGFASEKMGESGGGSYMNMPQNLHVGEKRLNKQDGFAGSSYGNAWVSHYVRGIEVDGFESFASEYDYQNFEYRMRVRNVETNIMPRQNIIIVGIDGYSAGMPDFKPGLHFIRPDGNSDQHRKGAF